MLETCTRILEYPGAEYLVKYWGVPPEVISSCLDIEVVECTNIPERFDDIIIFNTIIIPTGLEHDEKEYRIARCLGHYFMHVCNGECGYIWCSDKKSSGKCSAYELQAEIFAICLLSCKRPQFIIEPDKIIKKLKIVL